MSLSLIILVIILIILVLMYNSLIAKKNQVENIFASVDTQLKKRYDLIPNLVSSVQKYMKHEKSLLEEITSLRTQAINPQINDGQKIYLDNKFSKALGNITVAMEDYPELKANENLLQLQTTLNEVESQISAARRAYNQAVTDYNNAIEMIPTNLMASLMKYKRKELFEIEKTQRENVDVKELFES